MAEIAGQDPLLYTTPLPLRRTFYPFGFAATIATNCEEIVAAADGVWGRFERTEGVLGVELRIAVSDSKNGRPPATMPRGQGHLLSMVHDAGNFVHCDLREGFGFGWLTPAVARDVAYARYHFVEPAVYVMLESLFLCPVHAACLALDGRAVLLAGEQQAGKSTLAYACAKRGWTYICDDAGHLVRAAGDRVIRGNPHQIRLRPDARALFPELSRFDPFERPNGKPSLELDTQLLGFTSAASARGDYVVFLNRDAGSAPRLAPFDSQEALERLSGVLLVGEESTREEQRACLRRLLEAPVYEMTYQDLTWAEARLRTLMERGE